MATAGDGLEFSIHHDWLTLTDAASGNKHVFLFAELHEALSIRTIRWYLTGCVDVKQGGKTHSYAVTRAWVYALLRALARRHFDTAKQLECEHRVGWRKWRPCTLEVTLHKLIVQRESDRTALWNSSLFTQLGLSGRVLVIKPYKDKAIRVRLPKEEQVLFWMRAYMAFQELRRVWYKQLTIENRTTRPAWVSVRDAEDDACLAVLYVEVGATASTHLPPGVFYDTVLYEAGDGWGQSCERGEGFVLDQATAGIRMTLHPVPQGNYHRTPCSRDEF